MNSLVLDPATSAEVQRYISNPAQAVLLTGPSGSGKLSLARYMAAEVLKKPAEKLEKYPHYRLISPIDGKAIPIEAIRKLQHFTTLKIPGTAGNNDQVVRAVIIESANLMTTEAQNALLKLLEEPPLGTVFILTATSKDAVLPTIYSRTRSIQVVPPSIEDLTQHFASQFPSSAIEKIVVITGGLPGLTYALLEQPESHPLYEATIQARKLLQSTAYERLLLVDTLSKQKQLAIDTVFIIGQMARMALQRSTGPAAKRWQSILKASYQADKRLGTNTQAKLVLMQLMLEM